MDNNYSNFSNFYSGGNDVSLDVRVSAIMKRVYVKMFLGLLVSAFVSLGCASSFAAIQFFATNSWAMFALVIAELAIVFSLSGAINRLSSTAATALFFLFSALNGLTLFPIFLVYSLTAIYKTFFITAGIFGAMSIYGYFSLRDLTRWGTFLTMALFGLIIASLVNIFVHSSQLDWIISFAGVLIFVGLTAWDTQKIKTMAMMAPQEMSSKLATFGALSLYLDFVNLFLMLLRLFGGNSRD